MKLDAYFKRIGYTGTPRPDLETLNALMRAHVFAVPFENLDIYAARPADFSVEAAFDQIVTQRQGGWCYEMNELFGWVLTELGFEVTRLAGGVRRQALGDAALGNHLCLMVHLDQRYLVDVGFGSSQVFAIALEEAVTNHSPIQFALRPIENGFWRLHEGGLKSFISYDFKPEPADEALLRQRFTEQVTDPESIFRKTLVAKIRRDKAHYVLRGRKLETLWSGRSEARFVDSADDLRDTLKAVFALDIPYLDDLWPAICDRHRQMFPLSRD